MFDFLLRYRSVTSSMSFLTQNTSVAGWHGNEIGIARKISPSARTQAIIVFDGKSKRCEVIKSDLVQYIFLSGSPNTLSAERRETRVFYFF